MLTPFRGYLLATPAPTTDTDAASFARSIRDEAARYQSAAVLRRAIDDGLLTRSPAPTLYRYTITDGSGTVLSGVVGAAPVDGLLPHEETTVSAPQSSPPVEIRPVLAITEAVLPGSTDTGPGVEVVDREGRVHTLAPVALEGPMPPGPFVLADGHHRRMAAIRTWGVGCSVLTMVVGSSGGITAGTFHRRFARAGGLPPGAARRFDIEPIASPAPVVGALVWVEGTSGRAFALRPLPEALGSLPGPHRASGAAIASALLYPLVGVSDAAAVHVGAPEAATAGLLPGESALLLPPIDIVAVLAAARSGTPLPPKSSRFRPKPLRGLVLREPEA